MEGFLGVPKSEQPEFTRRNSEIKREENKFTQYPEREQNR